MSMVAQTPPMFASISKSILNILFPPRCIGCGVDGIWLCNSCLDRCGPPVDRNAPIKNVDRLLCLGSYDTPTLGKAIRDLKYSSGRVLAAALGDALGALLLHESIHSDCIVPVPLHRHRQRSRGFNQSVLLARGAASITGVPVRNVVTRTRNTVPQVSLSEEKRTTNVADAFSLATGVTAVPEHGIIVDDVFTTGATISEVAHVLRQAGMRTITALTVAKG